MAGNAVTNLVKELLEAHPPERRCPHLRVDQVGPYCGSPAIDGLERDDRRTPCGTASLQLWCLDKSRCGRCALYPKEGVK